MFSDGNKLPTTNKGLVWLGWVITVLIALFMIFGGGMKLTQSEQVVEGFNHLGWDPKLAVALGILEITCAVIYLVPQTAALGAILLTGYLGGAIATHVRLGEPFFIQAGLGVLVWLGIFLRDARLRAIIPFRCHG